MSVYSIDTMHIQVCCEGSVRKSAAEVKLQCQAIETMLDKEMNLLLCQVRKKITNYC